MDMKLASIRLVTNDVRALARFYSVITGFTQVGIEDYVELETPTGTLAISSKRAVDIFNAGAAVPAANRSAIVEFEVKARWRVRDGADRPAMGKPLNALPRPRWEPDQLLCSNVGGKRRRLYPAKFKEILPFLILHRSQLTNQI